MLRHYLKISGLKWIITFPSQMNLDKEHKKRGWIFSSPGKVEGFIGL
jgi:hypothetical protein